METITDPEQIRAVWEAGDMGEESLGGDSESGTYNRSNRPPAGPRPDADNPWALLPDDHPQRPKQCGGCGTKWVDAETARACERRHGDDIATTPAPVGAAVALDLDALHETICDNFTGMAEVRQAADLLVAEVRALTAERDAARAEVERLHEEVHAGNVRGDSLNAALEEAQLAVRQLCARAEAAEAEVRSLRAKVAAVEAWPLTLEQVHAIVDYLLGVGSRAGLIHGDTLNRAMGASARRRAALATTGEGE